MSEDVGTGRGRGSAGPGPYSGQCPLPTGYEVRAGLDPAAAGLS